MEPPLKRSFTNIWVQWVVPGLAACIAAMIAVNTAWFRVEQSIQRNTDDISALKARIERIGQFGEEGFLDPQFQAAENIHAETFLRKLLGDAGYRKLWQQFGQGNGGTMEGSK